MVRLAGLELLEILEQFERPFVTDARHFEEAFGTFTVTSHPEAVASTLAAAGQHPAANR